MSETYLILHKVSGEPAFDIAHKLETTEQNGEEMWIVSTSGHRAYPVAKIALNDLENSEEVKEFMSMQVPQDWPDHYQNARDYSPSERATFNIGALLSGLIPKVHRRF